MYYIRRIIIFINAALLNSSYRSSTVLFLFLFIVSGCGPSPDITPIDCPKKKLDIKMTVGYTGGVIKRDLEVVAGLNVSCDGHPVPYADVMLEYWWKDSRFVHVTDSNGDLKVERSVMFDPRGNEVTAVVRGINGTKVVKMKIESNWNDIMSGSASGKMK